MTSTPQPPPRLGRGEQILEKTTTRRSQSFSSSSHSSNSSFGSSLSSFHDDHIPMVNPGTPLQLMGDGVPFSWEKIPGIPKQLYASKKISDEPSLRQLLPLPPPANSFKKQSFRDEFSPRKSSGDSFREDPFFAAFVECSKEDHRHNKISSSKIVTKSISDRFGFIGMYATSCKTTCSVSESIVHLPRSRNYDLLNRRSRR